MPNRTTPARRHNSANEMFLALEHHAAGVIGQYRQVVFKVCPRVRQLEDFFFQDEAFRVQDRRDLLVRLLRIRGLGQQSGE
jgi:hypothetical protein